MAGKERFGFVSYYDIICPNSSLLFGRWLKVTLQFIIKRLRIKTSFFNNTIPLLDEPAEEERFLINRSSAYTDYWRFVFPLCRNKWPTCSQECIDQRYYQRWRKEYIGLLKLATYKHKGKQLVLKSPPNTERIKYLLEISLMQNLFTSAAILITCFILCATCGIKHFGNFAFKRFQTSK